MTQPLISVIVPIYSVEPYLNSCVQSIVGQTYDNLEIILVDDGSPDNCPSMCDLWAKKDSRIKVIHKENGGLSDARNTGLKIAIGKLISFIDSDDWIEPDFYETLHNAMKNTGADIAECGTRLINENGAEIKRRGVPNDTSLGKLDALRQLILENGVYQTVWNKLYRREMIEGIPFEKGKHHEDDFWTYQVFDRIDTLAVVSKPMYNYRQRGSSIIGTGFTIKRLDGLEARFKRMEYLQKYNELVNLTCQQFLLDCMWHLQCVLRCLKGQELQTARETILSLKARTPKVAQKDLTLNWKYRIWYAMFRMIPVSTARLRNILMIGQ